MPTNGFWKQHDKFKEINRSKTYEEKLPFWDLMELDYGNGKIPYRPSCKGFEDFHRSPARFRTINSPRQNGKSLSAVADLIPMSVDPRGGVRGVFLAEEYKLAEMEWYYFTNFLFVTDLHEWVIEQIERQLVKKGESISKANKCISEKTSKNPTIEINWPLAPKTIIEVRSYGKQIYWRKFEGILVNWIMGCEASQFPRDFYERHVSKRMARRGALFVNPSTPTGLDEFMHPMYQKGLEWDYNIDIDYEKQEFHYGKESMKVHPHHVSITDTYMNSYESFHILGIDNPYYPMDDFNSDCEKLWALELEESFFREKNFGEYVSKSGRFFDIIPDTLFQKSWERPYHEDSTHYQGIDIGSATESACMWLAVEPPEDGTGIERIIVHKELFETISYSGDLADIIIDENKPFDIILSRVDIRSAHRNSATSHRTAEQIMLDQGLNVSTNPKGTMPRSTIEAMIKIKGLILSGIIIIYEDMCPRLCHEIKYLEYLERKFSQGQTVQKD